MSTIKFNQWLNPDNTENYKCRAWVNFNGTGTVAIRASGNVSSITDGGVGLYTINFTNAMSDVNYSVVGSVQSSGVNSSVNVDLGGITPTISAIGIRTGGNSSVIGTFTLADTPFVSLSVFR